MSHARIGFACKLSEINAKKQVVSVESCNFKTTTISWLNRQSKDTAVEKLWSLLKHNLSAVHNLVKTVSKWTPSLRMVRIGSDMLPAYTEPNWCWFWQQPEVRAFCQLHLSKTGELARANDVRLSMHPGQFCVLASENPDIVSRSIEEFEYHVDIARWMGYGQQFQDFKINVHISGRAGPTGFIAALARLTPEARNCITVENDEVSWGLDSTLELADHCAVVLDLHHHFVHTGEYIDPNDPRISRVVASWRGCRPVMHYSLSREDVLVDHCAATMPDLNTLLSVGHKKGKLRAHSDMMWNTAVNQHALQFLEHADLMVEAKHKNLASAALFEQALAEKFIA